MRLLLLGSVEERYGQDLLQLHRNTVIFPGGGGGDQIYSLESAIVGREGLELLMPGY